MTSKKITLSMASFVMSAHISFITSKNSVLVKFCISCNKRTTFHYGLNLPTGKAQITHALLRLVSALYYNLVTTTSTEVSIKAGYRWSTAAFNTSHRRLLSVRARSRVRVSPYDIIGSHLWKKVLETPATICQKYFIHPSEGQNLPLSHALAK